MPGDPDDNNLCDYRTYYSLIIMIIVDKISRCFVLSQPDPHPRLRNAQIEEHALPEVQAAHVSKMRFPHSASIELFSQRVCVYVYIYIYIFVCVCKPLLM